MTILKNLMLSLAIAPLTVSMAFAAGGYDPITGIDVIVTEAGFVTTNVKQPMLTQESSGVRRQTIKPLAQTNPTRPSANEEKELYHDEKKSECYRRYGNPPTVTIGGKTLRVACEVRERRMEINPSAMLESGITSPIDLLGVPSYTESE